MQQVHDSKLIIFYTRIALPSTLLDDVIKWYHNIHVTPAPLVPSRPFPNISTHGEWKRTSEPSLKDKRVTQRYGRLPAPTDQEYEPWECVQANFFEPWKFKNVDGIDQEIKAISFIDVATRWPELHEYGSKSYEDTALIFDREWLNRYPVLAK